MKKIILTFSIATILFSCGTDKFDKNLLIGDFEKSEKPFVIDTVKLDEKLVDLQNQRLKTSINFSEDSTYLIKSEMFAGFDYAQSFDYKGRWIIDGAEITLMDSDTITYSLKKEANQIVLISAKDSIYLKKKD